MRPPLLPGRRATDLLQAMLLDGNSALEAWSRWTESVPGPKQALASDSVMARSLLALLYDSVRRNALPVDTDTSTYLRSAYHTESLRTRAYRAVVDEMETLLRGLPFRLIKGAAIGELYYRQPLLRHAHDIEIFSSDPASVRAALAGSPFRPAQASLRRTGDHYVHTSGLPLRVHARLCVSTEPVDATSALALTLVHATRSPSRATCRWICDAFFIARSAKVDWRRLTGIVIDDSPVVAVHAQLSWLHETLAVNVPASALAELYARFPFWRRWSVTGRQKPTLAE